jgi:ribosomal protein S6--L-glutamate ligase/tetrahydromethanopterin:alpha-L-glutamate ligase
MTSYLPEQSVSYTVDNPDSFKSGRQIVAPFNFGLVEESVKIRLDELKGLIVRSLPGGSLEQVIYRVNVLHYLEKLGIKVINSASVVEKTVDKFYTTALLANAGLPVPRTAVTENYFQAMEAVEKIGSVVVKPIFGSLGKGIVRIDEADTAHRVFKALELGRFVFYVQEYIESGGEDFRLMVAGGKVIGAMRRRAEHWKANISYGATADKYQPSTEMIQLALRTAEVLNADYVGVDIIVSEGKSYILEANSVPGWTGLQTVSDIDIAKTLAEFFLQRIGLS